MDRRKRDGTVVVSHNLLTTVPQQSVGCGATAGQEIEIKNLFGPTQLVAKSAQPLQATAAEVRAAIRALPPAKAIPASVEVAGQQSNAAEFLFLMAKIASGAPTADAPPLPMTPPVQARANRFNDPLSLLQMWTYKPAYFDKPGGRLQRATSIEVNLRSGRMWNEGQMRLLRPEDRPPW